MNNHRYEPLYKVALADLLDLAEAQIDFPERYREELQLLCAQIRLECAIPRANDG